MASSRIAGLKIELEIENKSTTLSQLQKEVSKVEKSLKDLEKSLKLDPKNTELLNQKMKLLGEQIQKTENYLKGLKKGYDELANKKDPTKTDIERMDKLKREISDVEKKLKDLKSAYSGFSSEGQKLKAATEESANAIKNMKSRLDEVKSALELNPTSATLLKQKFELLGEQIQNTKNHLQNLKTEYDNLASKSNKTEENKQRMQELEREISNTENELKNLTGEYNNFGSVGLQQTKAVGEQMMDLGNKIQSASGKLSSTGSQLTQAFAPLTAAFAFGGKQGMEFEKGMSAVQAVTGATAEDMADLETAAREMARQTVFSAGEAAEAEYYMGLAGWEAKDAVAALPGVMDLAAAGAVDLGRASSIVVDGMNAMGYEADETTNGIANATHFANVMAAAMSNSNTTVDLLGESFKYAAPLAGQLNYNIEDLTLGLGLMASSGIKGSQAGTGLRMALKNLAAPTEKQAQLMEKYGLAMDDGYGTAVPFRDVIQQFRDDFGGMNLELVDAEGNLKTGEQLMEEYGDSLPATQMEKFGDLAQIVGVRALPGVLGMINAGQEDFDKLAEAIDNADDSWVKIDGHVYKVKEAMELFGEELVTTNGEIIGTAEAMREIQLDNVSGDLVRLKDNFADLGIEVYQQVQPVIRDFISKLSEFIDKFREMDPETKNFIIALAGILAAIGPVLIIIGKLGAGVGALTTAFGFLVAHPVVLFIMAIAAAVIYLATHWEEFKNACMEIWNSLVEFGTALWEGFKWMLQDTWESVKTFAIETWEAIKEKFNEIWTAIKDFFIEIAEKIQEKWEAFKEKIAEIIEKLREKWEDFKQKLSEIADKIHEKLEDLRQKWEDFKQKVADIIENLRQKWEDFKQKLSDIFAKIKEKIEDLKQKWEDFKQKISDIVSAVKEKIEDLKQKIQEKIDSIKEKIETLKEKWESLKEKVGDIKDSIVQKVEDLKGKVDDAFKKIQEFMEDPIGAAKKFIDEKIEAIKGLFPISIGNLFSNLKLPHIDWDWKDIGGIVKIPTFSVSWYAKAMKNGMLLDGATIFGQGRNGQLLGGGEVGREWIVGENGLMSMIRGAVSQNQLSPDVIYSAVVRGMQDANVNVYMNAKKVSDEVGRQASISADSQNRYFGVR